MWFKKRSSSFVAPYMALFNMNALSVAMNAEQDVAVRALKLQLEKTQLALERARMSMEDARAAMASPYSTNGLPPFTRTLSWREFGKERNQRCDHVTFNVIEPATEALDQMCSDMRTKLTAPGSNRQPGYKALETVHNDMCRVLSILREEAFEGDELRCVVCENVSSPDWVNIVPAEAVPEVAPETRIVCGRCYAANPTMGEVDSFF